MSLAGASWRLAGAATTSLVRLKLVGCYITADGAITVASILHYAHALTDLDLSYNPLGG